MGCHILTVFLAAYLYADDMALMSPSIKDLVVLLQTCNEYCIEWDICLNARKLKLMYFGSRCTNLFTPSMNGTPLEWVESCTYLGINLVSSRRFKCCVIQRIKKFLQMCKCYTLKTRFMGTANKGNPQL